MISELENNLKQGNTYDDNLLFHYTTFDSAYKIIETKKLKFSNLSTTNDPLEFCDMNVPLLCEENISKESIARIMTQLELGQRQRKKFIRLLCFCQDLDLKSENEQNHASNLLSKGWARNRMWAQYAEDHKGVCLVFNKEKLKEQFKKIESDSCITVQNGKIRYSNYFHELEAAAKPPITHKNENVDFSEYYFQPDFQRFLFQKCEDFRDENEYRFEIINKHLESEQELFFIDFEDSLQAIILGERFPEFLKFDIHNIKTSFCLKYSYCYSIEQFRIEWNCGTPNLIPQN